MPASLYTSTTFHHVTAVAGPARRNIEFYTRTLGLRLVKKTVNFDDPSTYHFYYGDEAGRPGTILTFFPWGHAPPGRAGIGETFETAFRVPENALGYWIHRFIEHGVRYTPPEKCFGESVLSFSDPDGTRLALVGVPGIEDETAWSTGAVSLGSAILGLHGVTLLLRETARTAALITDVLGFSEFGREATLTRYTSTHAAAGGIVDLRAAGEFLKGRLGVGSVHHIAFRAADDATQRTMVQRLIENHRVRPTEQKDRNYFRSVYVHEPGGVLFEIATDEPGFAIDEPPTELGRSLKLPAGLEVDRKEIEAILPELG